MLGVLSYICLTYAERPCDKASLLVWKSLSKLGRSRQLVGFSFAAPRMVRYVFWESLRGCRVIANSALVQGLVENTINHQNGLLPALYAQHKCSPCGGRRGDASAGYRSSSPPWWRGNPCPAIPRQLRTMASVSEKPWQEGEDRIVKLAMWALCSPSDEIIIEGLDV